MSYSIEKDGIYNVSSSSSDDSTHFIELKVDGKGILKNNYHTNNCTKSLCYTGEFKEGSVLSVEGCERFKVVQF
jgi:hypothetical protein